MEMPLYLHLLIHLFFALLAGFFVWEKWRKPAISFLAAFAGGFLVDLDHLIDYFLHFGFDFRLDYFFGNRHFIESGKNYIFFHGWEYAVILLIFALILKSKTIKSLLLALALGMFFHLSADVYLNRMPFLSYSIIYRATNNFTADWVIHPERYREFIKTGGGDNSSASKI